MANRELALLREERAFFQEFYDDHIRLLYYAASRCTQDQELIRDIVQDTLVRLMQNTATLRKMNGAKTAAYLRATVKSVYIDHCRRRSNSEQPLESEVLEALGARTEPMDYAAKWDTQILRSRLSARDWYLLEARYIEGATDAEIAATLGCGADSVRKALSRARQRGKTILGDREERGKKYG